MLEYLPLIVAITLGVIIGVLLARLIAFRTVYRHVGDGTSEGVYALIHAHFSPTPLSNLTIAERQFPFRVRADLQRAVDCLFAASVTVHHFCGVRKEYGGEGMSLPALLGDGHNPAVAVPPQYEEVDVGADEPVRCLKNGLWLLEEAGTRYAVLLSPAGRPYGETTGVQFQIATPNAPAGTQVARAFFRHLEEAILKAESYRGKVLSLERAEHSYSGESAGIAVHRLRPVAREDVILPAATLDLLDRNVLQFARQRRALAGLGQSTRKGLLFYGPPGTTSSGPWTRCCSGAVR